MDPISFATDTPFYVALSSEKVKNKLKAARNSGFPLVFGLDGTYQLSNKGYAVLSLAAIDANGSAHLLGLCIVQK